MDDYAAIRKAGETTIGAVRYLRYEAAERYAATNFGAQLTISHNRHLTPAYLRAAARELAASILAMADELEGKPERGLKA